MSVCVVDRKRGWGGVNGEVEDGREREMERKITFQSDKHSEGDRESVTDRERGRQRISDRQGERTENQ